MRVPALFLSRCTHCGQVYPLSPGTHLHMVGMLHFMPLTISYLSFPTPFCSVLVSFSVFLALSTVFHSMNPLNSSLLSYSVLPMLFVHCWSFQLYIYLYESLSSRNIICSGWLGSKHWLTTNMICTQPSNHCPHSYFDIFHKFIYSMWKMDRNVMFGIAENCNTWTKQSVFMLLLMLLLEPYSELFTTKATWSAVQKEHHQINQFQTPFHAFRYLLYSQRCPVPFV